MSAPKRVKVRGSYFRGIVPADAVYVGRGTPTLPRSPLANPFKVKEHGREGSLRRYREHLVAADLLDLVRLELAGRDIACWCPLDQSCHGDILLHVAAGGDPLDAHCPVWTGTS